MTTTPLRTLRPPYQIVSPDECTLTRFGIRQYLLHSFRRGAAKRPEIICTMHRHENTNNIEVYKLALACRRRDIRLVMFGSINQFPLFSLFADAVILAVDNGGLENAYGDTDDARDHTNYRPPMPPPGCTVIDLSRAGYFMPDNYPPVASILIEAMLEITDEEVVATFATPLIHVLQASYDLFNALDMQNMFRDRLIVCEIKQFGECDGARLAAQLEARAEATGLAIQTSRAWLRDLCDVCGRHYMAVQCLASIFYKWSWVCYGGSANLFAFFPFKTLLLSDAYVHPSLSYCLSAARYGDVGFPYFGDRQEEFFAMSPGLAERIRRFLL